MICRDMRIWASHQMTCIHLFSHRYKLTHSASIYVSRFSFNSDDQCQYWFTDLSITHCTFICVLCILNYLAATSRLNKTNILWVLQQSLGIGTQQSEYIFKIHSSSSCSNCKRSLSGYLELREKLGDWILIGKFQRNLGRDRFSRYLLIIFAGTVY